MKITVFGAGYVGLVTAACLAEMGNGVVCVDVDKDRIALLNAGGVPIHEPGLDGLLQRNVAAGRLEFTTDAAAAVAHATLVFIAVGTPPAEDGSADLAHVLAAATTVGRHMRDYKVVVDKSTVPVGTADRVHAAIAHELKARGTPLPYAVVSNPEFLKEGAAIDDFMRPDRIVLGCDDEQAGLLLRAVYAPFVRNRDRLLIMDVRSAELTKYAANAMLATRISFMNELALLAEALGADIEQVRHGIGSDPRIGTHFLYAGCGWGGSCFPKDVRALLRTGAEAGQPLSLLQSVLRINQRQRALLSDRVEARFGSDLRGHVFALWGLAFKPGTDDLREAPSLTVVDALLERGAQVVAFDPVAMPKAAALWRGREGFTLADTPLDAVRGASALLLLTEWREFRSPDFDALKAALREPVLFDGRNLWDPAQMRELGFEYHGIGRGARTAGADAAVPLAPAAALAV
ncbi:UDP-glucose/GDP-mannose dehydrogenase family protein [Aquincola sp. S2]|uniref:UDP-glucose 6-dehydrogenase n=1 Tax=Pseudaquabacterium terrae TaxID=2732868 RepID=A0ABX2EK39_9BURK|nr:UDP-glucose/GDP-mannose dehydrogenase family protein [Aquabacterium terrae]NRF68904.1 UDP-glucose/GDP-mannose dehydrogenase family protein [Aquabacterium terrae]